MNVSEQLADVARGLQAEGVEGCSGKYAGLACGFMAPLAAVFAAWVLGRAREQGVQRLYFLSRDCQLILKAAGELSPQFGGIDCRYLQVSRQALFLPSSTGISAEGMPWLFENTNRHRLGVQLAKLELSVEEFDPQASAQTVLETGEQIQEFWARLNRPPLRDKLSALIETRRAAAQAYFEEQGLFDEVPWAVVDIGWLLRCQRALNDLLHRMGRKEDVRGFYLGVQADREPLEKTGPAEALFINPAPGCGPESPVLFKQVVLIENLFCTADHPTVHRYENGPAYNREVDPAALARFRSLEKVFAAVAGRCAGFAGVLADPDTARDLIEQRVGSFLNRPDAATLLPLMEMKISILQNDLNPFPVIRPLSVREALGPLFPRRRKLRVMWLRGSVVVSRPFVRKVYAAAYRIRSLRMRFKRGR
jgi:hypothetical protein